MFACTTLFGKAGIKTAGGITAGVAFLTDDKGTALDLTGLDTDLAAGLTAAFAAGLRATLGTGFVDGLDELLAGGLAAVLTGALTLTLSAFGAALEAGFFPTVLDLLAGWATFSATGLATTLETGGGFAAAFAAGLPTALPITPLTRLTDLSTFLAADAGLPAAWFAFADFVGFAFTAYLL